MADSVTEILLRARGDFSDLTGNISKLRKEFQSLKLPKDITENLEKGFNRLDPVLKSYQKQLDKGFKSKTDLKNFEATRNELDAIFNDISSEIQKINGQPIQLKADLKDISALEKKLDGLGAKLQKALDKITIKEGDKVTNTIDKLVASTSKAATIKPMTIKAQDLFNQQDFVGFNREIDKIQNKILSLSNIRGAKVDLAKAIMGPNFVNDVNAMDQAIVNFFNDMKVSENSLKGLAIINNDISQTGQSLNQLKTDSLVRGARAVEELGDGTRKASQGAKDLGASIGDAASSSVRMAEELQQLKTSTQYFFSLRNMINLFKRGVREAVDVIKELDAAMTETAVVTNYSVGDMWKKLPEYTANANALGASVKDMYEATTLYYQQGLNTEQAMGIANETMKMARIGGLEATDATDKMTAALRGFNMELSEVSAQRINDVYSNLAAKTASNTEELGTAMQRTASIAHSAGMSFEGTAAFLAQAIETTREPAENLGTAMKTIVARFQELKKNPLEITEVDGEEVSYNKVDTALQSIGVSLKDANGQFRDLDKVFLDISQKWDGLTQTQQRYIATTAAGSRQQSRFIAMMSNYDRTMELMSYANDSAGASGEQFAKTMESLEAKLNKLKNAWNEFLMGIMNDSMTKFVVDAGTKLLGILNDITDALSFGGKSGLLKSITSLTAAFIGLKTAGKLINWGVDKAGGLLSPSTPMFGFKGDGGKVSKTTATIVNPIVAEIRQVVAAIKNQPLKTNNGEVGTLQQYKDSQVNLRNLLGLNDKKLLNNTSVDTQKNLKYSQITDNLKGLSDTQQRQLLGTLPGLQQAMRRATLDLLKNNNVSSNSLRLGQQITKDIIKGMNKGAISVEKGIDLLRNPQKWGQYFGNQFNEGNLKEISKAVTGPEFNRLIEEAKNKYLEAGGSKEGLEKRKADFEKYAQRKLKSKAPVEDIKYDKYNQLGDKIGQVGAHFATAGQSVQQFGIVLSNIGFEKAGGLAIKLGSTISSLGMAFNGLGTILPKITERFSDAGAAATDAFKTANTTTGRLAKGGGAFFSTLFGSGAAAAAAGVAVAAVAAIAIKKYLEKKAKEAGEEVREQFEEKFTKADEKIKSLADSQVRFDELAKGVDQFGHNINLTSEEYDEYLSISRELQQLSPSLIAGYNAEGQAIIKKGEAIQEVIDKLEKEKQAELDLFTSNTSVDKLISEYQTSDAYKDYKEKGHTSGGDYVVDQLAFGSAKSRISRVGDENLLKSINQLSGWNLSSLDNITTGQLSWLTKHYNDVINLVEEQNGTLEDEVREGYTDAFTNAGVAIEEVMTEGKPIIDAMQMWMGTESIDAIGIGLGEEFGDSFNQGVEGIMLTGLSKGWNADEFKSNLRDYSKEWEGLAGSTSEYANIMEDAKDIQEEYLDAMGSDNAIENYNSNITESCNKLIELANNTDTATAAGQAFQQQCIAQANALRNYATEGGMSLSEALNTATDDIQRAEAALDNFNEATKTDLYTAAEGMKSIYDKAFETYKDSFGGEYEKHFEGKGDHTAWEAGRSILGEEALESIPDGQALKNKLKEWEPALREGEEGWYNFWTKITGDSKLMDDLNKIGVHWDEDDFYIPDSKWAEVAKTIGISEEMLTSMLNKGRQFADIDFTNWKEARHTFETSNVGIEGTTETENKNGQRKLYIKEETFEAALADANYKPEEYEGKKEEAREQQNFEFLKEASEYNKQELRSVFEEGMGINNLQDLISTLIETGDYTKDEIEDYAEKAGYEGDFEGLYAELAEAMENPELAKQTGVLETISAQIAALADTRTGEEAKADYDEAHKELVGKEGFGDTDAQAFAMGKKLARDEDGNVIYDKNGKAKLEDLTAGEFEQTKKSMQETADHFRETAAIAKEKAKTAPESEKSYWEAVQKGAEEDAARADKYVQMADEAMKKQEDAARRESEGKAKEAKARDEARKKQQEAEKAALEKANKDAQDKGKKQTDYENNKPKTEAEGKIAKDKGREAERRIKEEEGREKEVEARNKVRETEQKQEEALRKKEAEGREKEVEARNKAREAEQKQEEALRQKEAEGRAKEVEARNKAKEEEQARLAAEQQEAAGRQQEVDARNKAKQETQTTQLEDIQGKADYLLRTSINTSLKNALNNLDPAQIAQDPVQSQAFANLYSDLINNRLPKPEDLDNLGILNQLDSQYQDQITGAIEEKSSILGENFNAAYQAFAQVDKAALAMDAVPTNDKVSKAITTVGQRLKNWWDKINDVNSEAKESSNVAPTINTGTQTVANIAKDAVQDTQGKITVDTSDGEAKITNLKALVDSTVSAINRGATFNVKVGDSKLSKVAKQAKAITKVSGDKSINVTATASGEDETKSLTTAVKDFKGLGRRASISLHVGVSGLTDVRSAITAVNNFYNLRDDTVTLTTKHKDNATGAHNHGYASSPSFGSAARGSYGQLGPKGKGGLTLTGELGYEIAWLPSENRSMILGANGPQMINLPGNAVVWTHEQSKRILKQKSIPAGSHSAESKGTYNSNLSRYASGGGGGGAGVSASIVVQKAAKAAQKAVTTAAVKIGKVSVWWENIARTTEGVQRKADKAYSEFQKYIKEIQATLKLTGTEGQGNKYIKNMSKVIGKNQAQYNKANKSLKKLDKSNKKTTIKYKQGKKEKKSKVKLSSFIQYDKESGSYTINQKKLNKIAKSKKKGGKAKAQAIKDAAEKKINDKLSKRNKAEDAILKAKEALDKFGEELYNTFFAWENELTEIWNLTQKIESIESKGSNLQGYLDLLDAQLDSGLIDKNLLTSNNYGQTDYTQEYLHIFQGVIQTQIQAIHTTNDLIQESTQNLSDLLTSADTQATLEAVRKKLASKSLNATERLGYEQWEKELTETLTLQSEARQYITPVTRANGTIDINFNAEGLKQDKIAGRITGEKYTQIKKYIEDGIIAQSKALSDLYDSTESKIASLYQQLADLKKDWAEQADTLMSYLEDQQAQEIESIRKISDAIANSLKNLLDKVKDALDERRKREDNVKTEESIVKKQQRLAMLRADTSGGHQVEIAQLQQEIVDDQMNYQRTLEDQLLDRLQKQADTAQKQREEQISLQEAILQSVDKAAIVNAWMDDPAKYRSEIQEAFYSATKYADMPLAKQEALDSDFDHLMIGLEGHFGKEGIITNAINNLADLLPQIRNQMNELAKEVFADNPSDGGSNRTKEQVYQDTLTELSAKGNNITFEDIDTTLRQAGTDAGYGTRTRLQDLANMPDITWKDILKVLEGKYNRYRLALTFSSENFKKAYDYVYGAGKYEANRKYAEKHKDKYQKYQKYAYATGGLNTTTGLAWLDGTPSKPELVLNSTDTKNFLALRDILSKAIGSANSITNSYGSDATYEININVDHLSNDYDVDKVAERVKKIIVKDSSYRNVTQVRNFR